MSETTGSSQRSDSGIAGRERITKTPGCTICGSTDIRRSRFRWYEAPLRMFTARPYRCDDCDARFWLRLPERRPPTPND